MATETLAFRVHGVALGLWLGVLVGFLILTRRPRWRADRRQVVCFVGGVVLAVATTAWPLEDLATHRLLTALVVQRLVLMLAVAPLLLAGCPDGLLASMTRPAPIDAVVRRCTHPMVAVVVVTVVSIGTLTAGAVSLQARSAAAAVLFDLALVLAGVVLWAPILRRLPGTPRLSPLGCAAYLIVQSIVPSFLSVVWVLSRHPLYPVYAHAPRLWGVAPLTDQIVAGFVAKLTTIAVLWTVAFVIVTRADHRGDLEESTELRWADVEREFERAERRRNRLILTEGESGRTESADDGG